MARFTKSVIKVCTQQGEEYWKVEGSVKQIVFSEQFLYANSSVLEIDLHFGSNRL